MADFRPGVAGSGLAPRGKEPGNGYEAEGEFCIDASKIGFQKNKDRSGELAPSPAFRKLKLGTQTPLISLKLLEELASRTGNVNSSRGSAFAVLHALHDTSGLAALRTVRALAGIHDLFPVRRLCNLSAYRHGSFLLISITQHPARFVARMIVDGMLGSSPENYDSTLEDSWLRLCALPPLSILP
jgi:hypothetical protein